MGRAWRWVELGLEGVIALSLIAMTLLTVTDVAGRYFFNAPLGGGYELSEMLMALTVFSALPLVARADAQLTVDLVTDRLTGRVRRVHRVVVLLISALALAFVAWRMGVQAVTLARTGAATGSLQLPLAPLGWVMTGLAWFACAVTGVLLARAAMGRDANAPQGRRTAE